MNRARRLTRSQEAIVFGVTLLIFVAASIGVRGFASTDNLIGLLQAQATLGLLSLGMGIVVISRGIDLSMIALAGVAPSLMLSLVQTGIDPWVAFLIASAFAMAFGILNGWLIAYVGLSAIFATLATSLIIAGLGNGVFKYDTLTWPSTLDGWAWIGRSSLATIPAPLLLFLLALVVAFVFLSRTRIGQFIYEIGDNPNAARGIGVSVRPITLLLYVLSALIAFATGLVIASVLGSVSLRAAGGALLYDVILVVVIGGIGLAGGRGSALSILVGAMFIGTFTNALTLLNASYSTQSITKGILLLLAILLDAHLNPTNEETNTQGDI